MAGMDEYLKKLEAEVRASIDEISARELMRMMEDGENFLLVDVREADEYEAGHIEGALNVPRGRAEWVMAETFRNPALPLVFYCRTGIRSAFVAKAAREMGFQNVKNLRGSIKEWLEEGYEVFNRLGSVKLTPEGFGKKDR